MSSAEVKFLVVAFLVSLTFLGLVDSAPAGEVTEEQEELTSLDHEDAKDVSETDVESTEPLTISEFHSEPDSSSVTTDHMPDDSKQSDEEEYSNEVLTDGRQKDSEAPDDPCNVKTYPCVPEYSMDEEEEFPQLMQFRMEWK